MSFTTWDVNGYGINEDDAKLVYGEEETRNFLKTAPITKAKVEKDMTNEGIACFADYETDDGKCGIDAIVVMAISEKEGISLEYHCAENGNFILFPPYYPWQSRLDKDAQMTEEKLDTIFKKYFGTEGRYVSAQYQG